MAEITVRDWMVIIGVLLIAAVLLDAWRRVLKDRRGSNVRMKLQPQEDNAPASTAEDINWLKELPNGGARVVRRGDIANQETGEPEPVAGPAGDRDDEPLVSMTATEEERQPDGAAEEPVPDPMEPGVLPRAQDSEVFMLNVVARDPRGFRGEDILHILLACDLRFGDMNFFHRHEFEAGKGAIQFSVANMVQPGVFDIDNMGDFTTKGLVFFLTLPGPEDMMQAFDYMLETARTVARNLGGDVLDESRSVLTKQSLEHSRQQIRDLERRLLARAQ